MVDDILNDIMCAPPTIPEQDVENLYRIAAALPQAEHGGCLELGDSGLATSLAIVILAGLEALDE